MRSTRLGFGIAVSDTDFGWTIEVLPRISIMYRNEDDGPWWALDVFWLLWGVRFFVGLEEETEDDRTP